MLSPRANLYPKTPLVSFVESFVLQIELNPSFTVVRVPNHAVLSMRSCSLSEHIPFALDGWDAQLGLTFALYSEM